MSRTKQPWHTGAYQRLATLVTDRANADPTTRCWRCGLTLAQHEPHANGKPATWTAGHKRDGEIIHTIDQLGPEASTCNYRWGAAHGNGQRKQGTTHTW